MTVSKQQFPISDLQRFTHREITNQILLILKHRLRSYREAPPFYSKATKVARVEKLIATYTHAKQVSEKCLLIWIDRDYVELINLFPAGTKWTKQKAKLEHILSYATYRKKQLDDKGNL